MADQCFLPSLHKKNILIEAPGNHNALTPLIADFGQSRFTHDTFEVDFGKESHRAPECGQTKRGFSTKETDIFALGKTFKELLKARFGDERLLGEAFENVFEEEFAKKAPAAEKLLRWIVEGSIRPPTPRPLALQTLVGDRRLCHPNFCSRLDAAKVDEAVTKIITLRKLSEPKKDAKTGQVVDVRDTIGGLVTRLGLSEETWQIVTSPSFRPNHNQPQAPIFSAPINHNIRFDFATPFLRPSYV